MPVTKVAEWLYDVCELYEDDDLDVQNADEVIKRAFMSSNCDDFAWLLSKITTWPTIRITWTIPDWGFGHHMVVRSPDGSLLDVRGWTDEEATRLYFGVGPKTTMTLSTADPSADWTDAADSGFQIMLRALKSRDVAPFNTLEFRAMIDEFEATLPQTFKLA